MWGLLLLVGCAAIAGTASGEQYHVRIQRAAQHNHHQPKPAHPPPPVHSKPPPKPLPPHVPPPPVHSKPPPKPHPQPAPPPPVHSKPPPKPHPPPVPPPPVHSKPPPKPHPQPAPPPPVHSKPPPHPAPKPGGPQVQPVRPPPGKHHRRSIREVEDSDPILELESHFPFETFFIRQKRSAPARANAPEPTQVPPLVGGTRTQGPQTQTPIAKSAPARGTRAVSEMPPRVKIMTGLYIERPSTPKCPAGQLADTRGRCRDPWE